MTGSLRCECKQYSDDHMDELDVRLWEQMPSSTAGLIGCPDICIISEIIVLGLNWFHTSIAESVETRNQDVQSLNWR